MLGDEIIEFVPHCLLRFLKYLRWALLGHGSYLGWVPYFFGVRSCVAQALSWENGSRYSLHAWA